MSFKQLPFTYVELYVYMHVYIYKERLLCGGGEKEKTPLPRASKHYSSVCVISNMIYTTNGFLLNILHGTRLSHLVQSAHFKF